MNGKKNLNPLMSKIQYDIRQNKYYLESIEENIQNRPPINKQQTPNTSIHSNKSQKEKKTFYSYQTFHQAQSNSIDYKAFRNRSRNKSRNNLSKQKSFLDNSNEKQQKQKVKPKTNQLYLATDYSDLVSNKDQTTGFFSKVKNQKQIRGFLFIGKQIKDQLSDIKFRIDKFKLYACDCEAFRLNEEMCNNIRYFLNYFEAAPKDILFQEYNSVLSINYFSEGRINQIQKDVVRTFSSQKYFQNKQQQQGFQQLERLLKAISTFNQIGYVQGMNYIAASFLWHCHEEFGYFLIIKLFEKLDVTDNYNENLTGILKHCNDFWSYLEQKDQKIFENLSEKGIQAIIIFTEWFVTLGTSIIPLTHHLNLYQHLYEQGWDYFYALLHNFLKVHFNDYQDLDTSEALMFLKQEHLLKNKWNQILKIN